MRKIMKKCAVCFCTAVLMVLTLTACSQGGNSMFGEIETYKTEYGSRAITTVNKDDLTDEALLTFYNETIVGSEFDWFTLDFGDGTGYVFYASLDFFAFYELNEEGLTDTPEIGMGYILEDSIEFKNAIPVPTFETVKEYQEWALENNIEILLINESFETVEDGTDIIEVLNEVAYEDDYIAIIV